MVKIRKYANGIERFLHGEKGQRFFNFAYSIGAAIVIWGALFKILHLPGGSTLLCIGMGTEIAMFILTAFDRPPKEYAWEDVFPVLDSRNPEDRPDFTGGGGVIVAGGGSGNGVSAEAGATYPGGGAVSGNGLAGVCASPAIDITAEDTVSLRDSIQRLSEASEQLSQMGELASATQTYLQQMQSISDQMSLLSQTTSRLNDVSSLLLKSYEAITGNSDQISQSSLGYVGQMEDLNRNIGGLNTIYEIQLKSISSQLESIDRVNRGLKDIRDMYEKSAAESSRYCEETEKMARYMKQINKVYEKMITAMTINMANPMMGSQMGGGANPFAPESQNTNI